MQAVICEISQMEECASLWDAPHMSEQKTEGGISALIVAHLERLRPIVQETGKPLSDNRWCQLAGVNPGFWRDLRSGSEPGIDRLNKIARIAGVSLSKLVEAAEAEIARPPSEDRLTVLVAGLLESIGLADEADEYARTLARRLPAAFAQISGPLALLPTAPVTIVDERPQRLGRKASTKKQ